MKKVRDIAEMLATKLRDAGFTVHVCHSTSLCGQSSYVWVGTTESDAHYAARIGELPPPIGPLTGEARRIARNAIKYSASGARYETRANGEIFEKPAVPGRLNIGGEIRISDHGIGPRRYTDYNALLSANVSDAELDLVVEKFALAAKEIV